MRGVTQRIEGWPRGECARASYATLFECPIECIPRLDPEAAAQVGTTQDILERRWLASIGLDLVEYSVPPDKTIPQRVLDSMPQIPHLISGVSPRGFGHRCVGFGGRVIWDPHPSRAGLVTVYSVGLILPLVEQQ